MDIKIAGITEEIMKAALAQAKDGRVHILGEMGKAIEAAPHELGEHAPHIETIKIPTDKIREVIGSGGKVIREIIEKPAPRSTSRRTARSSWRPTAVDQRGMEWIKSIASEPEIGQSTKARS